MAHQIEGYLFEPNVELNLSKNQTLQRQQPDLPGMVPIYNMISDIEITRLGYA